MLKTMRFYAKYGLQTVAVYGAFAAFIVVGANLQGSLDGIFGTYAAMLPNMGLVFGCVFGASVDLYLNVAVSMGARRTHCFWAFEIVTFLSQCSLPVYTLLLNRLVGHLPDSAEVLTERSLSDWGVLLLGMLVVQQLGLMVSRLQGPNGKAVAMIGCSLLSTAGMVAVTLLGDAAFRPGNWGVLAVVAEYIHPILAVLAAALGAVVYKLFRKAVVTV